MMILLREPEQPQTSNSPCASIIPLRRRDWTGMGVCFQSVVGGCSSRQGPRRGPHSMCAEGALAQSLGSSQSSSLPGTTKGRFVFLGPGATLTCSP